MISKFNHTSYKKRIVSVWNEVARNYHENWASKDIGPFKSTSELLKISEIKKGDRVLDLACGTGAVTRKIARKVGTKGSVIGIDISPEPIKIARKWVNKKNSRFIVSDVEKMKLDGEFDRVTCQYGFMFFPDTQLVLKKIRHILKRDGKVAFAVHGNKKTTPYFSCISNVVLKFIPDFIPPGTPTVHRFGTSSILRKEFVKAGLKNIKIFEFNFWYKPGTFEDYWNDYFCNLSNTFREKFEALDSKQFIVLKRMIKKNTLKFTKNGRILFPWKVLIITATNPKKL